MQRIKKITKKVLLLTCVVFTFLTISGSIINIALGHTTDAYSHILDRANLTLIGATILILMLEFKMKNKVLNFLVPYSMFMSLALSYTYISGLFITLHKNAYRDIFLNDTLAYIIVYFGLHFYEKFKNRSK